MSNITIFIITHFLKQRCIFVLLLTLYCCLQMLRIFKGTVQREEYDRKCCLRIRCPKLQTQFSRKQAQNARFLLLNTSVLGLFSRKRGSINSGTVQKKECRLAFQNLVSDSDFKEEQCITSLTQSTQKIFKLPIPIAGSALIDQNWTFFYGPLLAFQIMGNKPGNSVPLNL